MNERNYLKNKEGIRKMRALIEDYKVVMMASQLDKTPFSICPMTLLQMDAKGDLWFFTAKDSGLFGDIGHDNRVQIIYCDQKRQKYLSIFGSATHIMDDQKKDELWNCGLLDWFEGKDDPNLALLSVDPQNAYYWDSENNLPVSFFEVAVHAVSGESPNQGVKGYVEL